MPTSSWKTLAALTVLLASGLARAATTPFTLDANHWSAWASGSGPTATLSGASVVISFPATASGTEFGGGAATTCALRGDFDVRADFRLPEWPVGSGVRSALIVRDPATGALGAVDRTSFGSSRDYPGYPREVYLAGFPEVPVGSILATSDAAGTLRLVRSGTTLTAYHAAPDGWTTVWSSPFTAADVRPALSAWSHDYAFTDQAVQLAFEGFGVDRGTVVCGGRVLVPVDVKPGSFPNPVNLGSNGVTPVAILSTPDFDATTVDPASVTVAGAPLTVRQNGTLIWSIEDVDADARLDLLVHVDTRALQVVAGTTSVTVEGTTFGGTSFAGSDAIVVVP